MVAADSIGVWNLLQKEADKEFADIVEICQQQGYITVKDMIREFGVTRYHANKVLNDLCEEPAARMYATKEGPVNALSFVEEGVTKT